MLYVKESSISGGGLFCTRDTPKGAVIGEYTGARISKEDLKHSRVPRGYVINFGNEFIDASDVSNGRLVLQNGQKVDTNALTQRGWSRLEGRGVRWIGSGSIVRFANHSTTPNCKLQGRNLIAKRTIKAHEELVWNYGRSFFNDVHSDVCDVCNGVGSLLCCDMCTRAFHFKCVGLKPADVSTLWFCKTCSKKVRGRTPRRQCR